MRNLFRFIQISRILIRYRLDSLLLSTPLLKSFKVLLYFIPWHYFPVKKYTRGERIRLALEELGPIFIKFGQTLSTRRDLLPDDIGDELAKLQDSCPAFDGKIAQKMIEKSLGASVETLFASFDIIPLASASIAQVHTAVTLDNEAIIIKVVRPEIEKHIGRDIRLLYGLAKFANKHPDGARLRPIEAVAEFERIILGELNMMAEAANAALLRKNFADSDLLYVPKVYWDFCRHNVLVTERIYGIPIGDIEALKTQGVDFKKLAEDGVKIFFTQVFKHNFFHADMHPGNIFVDKNGQYVGVDFGIMGSLSPIDQNFIAQTFLAFFNQDYQRVAQIYVDSGWVPEDINILAFEAAIRSICEPMFEKPLGEISFGQVLLSLLKEAKNFNITIQPQLLLLDKTLLNIEGLGRELYPDLDLWASAKPLLEQISQEKYSLKNAFETIKRQAPELIHTVPALTLGALTQIAEMGKMHQLSQQKMDATIRQLQQNSARQTWAILASVLVLLGAAFVAQGLWILAIVSGATSLVFWLKSSQ